MRILRISARVECVMVCGVKLHLALFSGWSKKSHALRCDLARAGCWLRVFFVLKPQTALELISSTHRFYSKSTLNTTIMNLVMFDIDGTLTRACAAEDSHFLQTMTDLFGFCDVSTDWGSYRHCSDSGILNEVIEQRLGRQPTGEEITEFQTRFASLLKVESISSPIQAIAGASEMLEQLARTPNLTFSLATGGWECWGNGVRGKWGQGAKSNKGIDSMLRGRRLRSPFPLRSCLVASAFSSLALNTM